MAHLNLGLVYSDMGQKSRAFEIFSGILSIGDDGLKDPRTHTDTQVQSCSVKWVIDVEGAGVLPFGFLEHILKIIAKY